MATETTVTSARAWSPDVNSFAAAEVVPESLILQTSTVSGSVEGDAPAVRVAYVDDAAATFVAEGDVIPEADPTLAEVLVFTGKVSQLVRLSREQWQQEGVAAVLSDSVRRAVIKRADEAYLTQAKPTAPAVSPAAGLLNISGIVNGGAIAGSLDGLVDAIATIEGNGGQATHIVLAPNAWASLRKFKAASGSAQGLLGAGTHDSVRMLLDLPVLVSSAMPSNTGLVIDRSAVVSAVGNVLVAQSEHVYFAADSVALRCTWRFGANLVRPNRVAKFTVTAPA